jgi:hypothetical protein
VAGGDHGQRAEFAFQRVEGQADRFERERAQERAVALFAEDHVGHADLLAAAEEPNVSFSA